MTPGSAVIGRNSFRRIEPSLDAYNFLVDRKLICERQYQVFLDFVRLQSNVYYVMGIYYGTK